MKHIIINVGRQVGAGGQEIGRMLAQDFEAKFYDRELLLTLYWTVSQVFSILQMKYGMIIAKREEEKASSARQP